MRYPPYPAPFPVPPTQLNRTHRDMGMVVVVWQAAMYVICNEKREAFEQAKVIEGDMKTYCRNMNSPNFFGGEPELFVLAEELRRPIAVYVPQAGGFKAIVEYGAKYARERSRIRILYNGQNHYDALLD